MIVLKEKYKEHHLNVLEQEYRQLIKEQKPAFFNKYFEEK
tara:strand:- start:865 stop:984 length:120 start_codon:yes stop_codon:yes gene_type:complete